mmetsp:Transcript_24942/g.44347  ORF Transcript_24942/g.44347 Transcript_24942/m.44347 type:complete len:378 (-) Transcript_24942:213-1346(-)|eukprot:CAMPEP_0197520682 /NCGR_PEP_ID=MMETSP1318-20131121/6013_1 /TAXON_ID=552666 /ORGANISM="Partenskyella glossopodia, Strain RCC365" /LENGTH=377 /DNA_ID=CAMNT_0043072365 /DNA_START=97 /DNA_END=1230 /DNA_ORIENTATION=+
MPLEAVMVCMDNSEFQRNGDYSPNRLIAQRETINHISLSKTESNMESTVGLLTMGGRAKVLCAPTRNLGALMSELKEVQIFGKCDFLAGIKTAQLALKNRQNKNQHPRIIVFVGSPIDCDQKKLTKLGTQLKKNNFAVDVINFGKENAANTNVEKLEAFINAVNNDDNSHLVNIPPGPHVLSDMVITSSILGNAPQPAAFGTPGGNSGFAGGNLTNGGGGGVGAEEEAMLAYALRISMEEARDRQQNTEESKEESKKDEESKGEPSKQEDVAGQDGGNMELDEVDDDVDEEDELARAMALSMAVEEADDDAEAQEEGADADAGDVDDEIMQVFKEEKFIEDLIDSTGVQKDDIDIQKILDFGDKEEGKDEEEDKGKK